MLKEMRRKSKRQFAIALMAMVATGFGCGRGSSKNVKIDGIDGPNVSFVDGKFIMSVIFKDLNFDGGAEFPIPKMPNSFLQIGPDLQSNGMLLLMAISVEDLKTVLHDYIDTLDPLTLPGGRPLPGLADGYLPGIAMEVPKLHHVAFYFGNNVFGTFIPVKLPWRDFVGTFRFYDPTGTRIGNISVVGQDQTGANSGFLLLVDLAGQVAQIAGM